MYFAVSRRNERNRECNPVCNDFLDSNRMDPVLPGSGFLFASACFLRLLLGRHSIESPPANAVFYFRLSRSDPWLRRVFGPITRSARGRALGHKAKTGVTVPLSRCYARAIEGGPRLCLWGRHYSGLGLLSSR